MSQPFFFAPFVRSSKFFFKFLKFFQKLKIQKSTIPSALCTIKSLVTTVVFQNTDHVYFSPFQRWCPTGKDWELGQGPIPLGRWAQKLHHFWPPATHSKLPGTPGTGTKKSPGLPAYTGPHPPKFSQTDPSQDRDPRHCHIVIGDRCDLELQKKIIPCTTRAKLTM